MRLLQVLLCKTLGGVVHWLNIDDEVDSVKAGVICVVLSQLHRVIGIARDICSDTWNSGFDANVED